MSIELDDMNKSLKQELRFVSHLKKLARRNESEHASVAKKTTRVPQVRESGRYGSSMATSINDSNKKPTMDKQGSRSPRPTKVSNKRIRNDKNDFSSSPRPIKKAIYYSTQKSISSDEANEDDNCSE